jgi:zinc protease
MPPRPGPRRAAAFALWAAICVAQDADSRAATTRPVRFALDNGLEVVLRPVARAKAAAVLVRFRIGEAHDPPGASGVAHALEHLWCTVATKDVPASTYEAWSAERPLGCNAQTAADSTFVATVVAADRLDAELADFASRLVDLRPSEEDLRRERERLKAEVANMFGGLPVLTAPNLARAELRDPSGRTRPGGLPATFDALPLETAAERLRKLYRAGNARLVVVGKFDAGAVAATIRERCGPAPRGEPPPTVLAPPRPDSRPLRIVDVGGAANPRDAKSAGYAAVAIEPPALSDLDFAAYFVAMRSLSGRSAALRPGPERPVVRFAPLDDPTFCAVVVGLRDGETPADAEARLLAWIAERLARIDERDIASARQVFDATLGLGRRGDAAVARNLYGAALALGAVDDETLDRVREALAALTVEDLRARLPGIFGPTRRAVAVVRAR